MKGVRSMAGMPPAECPIAAIARTVHVLVVKTGEIERFREMIDSHLRPIGMRQMEHAKQSRADDAALLAAVKAGAPGGAIPPTPEHAWRDYWKRLPTPEQPGELGGVWMPPSPRVPDAPHDPDDLPYQYALLAAAHDSICTEGSKHERETPFWIEPKPTGATVEAFMVLAWRDLLKAVYRPTHRPAMVAKLLAAMERVKADLDARGKRNRRVVIGDGEPAARTHPVDVAPVVPHAALKAEIREWVDAHPNRRSWLGAEWETVAGPGPRLPHAGDWREVATLAPDQRYRVAVKVVVGIHDDGSVHPIRPPGLPEAREGPGVPWHLLTLDALHEAGMRFIHDAPEEMVREYFKIVRAAWDAAHPPSASQGNTKSVRVSKDEANIIARDTLKADPAFANKSARQWSESIGCSLGLVAELPVWKAVQEQKRRALPASRPGAVSLTPALEANVDRRGKVGKAISTGTKDTQVLNALIAEQARDDASDTIHKEV